MSTTFDVRPFAPSDEQGVLDLLRTALGEGPSGMRTAEYFGWKHFRNPFGPSYLALAESEGRIVGLRAFMRWWFDVDGRRVLFAVYGNSAAVFDEVWPVASRILESVRFLKG